MLNITIKQQIANGLKAELAKFPSAKKMAVAMGINPAQLSRIMKGETDGVLSDANWLSIARRLNVAIGAQQPIVAASTPTYEYITAQLEMCQNGSLSAMLCDYAGIGKTFTARHYVRQHKNAIYVDCSQAKSKQKLIRAIAREFGIDYTGRYADVYSDLVYYLRSIERPLIILDEAGDLDYPATLELKALWNATEYLCGWYLMGADGLKAKFDRQLHNKKVGYAELFRRFGERYQRITPEGKEAMEEFKRRQIAIVAKANGLTNVQELYHKTQGSLTRLYIEIQKFKQAA
ncbi:MAG: AAA family ATPase [Candidatus Kryptoniota bacterium]